MKVLDRLRQMVERKPQADEPRGNKRCRDPEFVGRSSRKEIEQASPEKAAELAGHAVERVDT